MTVTLPGRIQPYIDPDEVLAAVIPLFAREPGLIQKLLDKSGRHVLANKPHSFFDDLFVGASHPAIGASYDIVGYRLRNSNELDLVVGALDPDFCDLNRHDATSEKQRPKTGGESVENDSLSGGTSRA
jgi:hypothetical protein